MTDIPPDFTPEHLPEPAPRLSRFAWLLLGISVLVIATFILAPPWSLMGKADVVGKGICHQIPSHSLFFNNQQLPLCARCTGIYLGALWGFILMMILGRFRAIRWPSAPILAILISFTALMGIDGVNSYIGFFPALPRFYESQNWLRLVTGTMHGLTMSVILLPIISESLWHPSLLKNEPVIRNFKDFAMLVAGAAVIILIVLTGQPFLLYPLSFLTTITVLLMLASVFTVFALFATGQMSSARTWQDTLPSLAIGLAGAILIIGGMYFLRVSLIGDAPLAF
ncbi:MAG TPA: DUF2085 domain-containing protein [Chloroflexi bacterium]|nr:DUF2085 domain-containing protein [Chloroflexota bacterium]